LSRESQRKAGKSKEGKAESFLPLSLKGTEEESTIQKGMGLAREKRVQKRQRVSGKSEIREGGRRVARRGEKTIIVWTIRPGVLCR